MTLSTVLGQNVVFTLACALGEYSFEKDEIHHLKGIKLTSRRLLARSVLLPDLGNGRGMGWAAPLASIVRHRRSYFPGRLAVISAAQWTIVLRIGHSYGLPVAESIWRGTFGSLPSGSPPPQCFGGGRISASFHSALVK
jgi:hypothetical protein